MWNENSSEVRSRSPSPSLNDEKLPLKQSKYIPTIAITTPTQTFHLHFLFKKIPRIGTNKIYSVYLKEVKDDYLLGELKGMDMKI